MKIVVCIKQVPDAKDIQWTSNNTMKRESVESIINPCDLYALEAALNLKRKNSEIEITVISMGPKQAENALRQAIALGADGGILLCDKSFSGSDTLATGLTISTAIQKFVPDCKLVICGQYASDGDTAQTGVEIAQNLNLNQITYVMEVVDFDSQYIVANQKLEAYEQTVQTPLPSVICVCENKDICLSDATILGQMRAQDADIKFVDLDALGLNENQVGIKGSPTYVSNVFRPKRTRKCEIIETKDILKTVNSIIDEAMCK